jgi:hypothetical protein
MKLNVHGVGSRYKTSCLEICNAIPEVVPLEQLARHLIGSVIYINYPHFIEAFVTAVSNSEGYIRGTSSQQVQPWSIKELSSRPDKIRKIIKGYVSGEQFVGSGGITLVGGDERMEELDVLVHIRPFGGLVDNTAILEQDGTPTTLSSPQIVKTYMETEMEVPLFVTSWIPVKPDPRLQGKPIRLEVDPYTIRVDETKQSETLTKQISSNATKKKRKTNTDNNKKQPSSTNNPLAHKFKFRPKSYRGLSSPIFTQRQGYHTGIGSSPVLQSYSDARFDTTVFYPSLSSLRHSDRLLTERTFPTLSRSVNNIRSE